MPVTWSIAKATCWGMVWINIADGYHLWSERYDREMKDVFAIQDEIVQAIVAALKIRLTGQDPVAVKHDTENIEAYQVCLKGRFHANKLTEASFKRAIQLYEQALARQKYRPAVCMASVYFGLGEKENSRAWLERAMEQRDGGLIYFKAITQLPGFSELASPALLERIGFV